MAVRVTDDRVMGIESSWFNIFKIGSNSFNPILKSYFSFKFSRNVYQRTTSNSSVLFWCVSNTFPFGIFSLDIRTSDLQRSCWSGLCCGVYLRMSGITQIHDSSQLLNCTWNWHSVRWCAFAYFAKSNHFVK